MLTSPKRSDMKPAVSYRLTPLGADGRVIDTIRLNAADDAAAIGLARVLAERHAVDLWDGLRLVEHIEPTG